MKIGVIGGGMMAEAIISGVLRNKVADKTEITASDVSDARRKHLETTYSVTAVPDNRDAAKGAKIVILAVKPQNASDVLSGLRGHITPGQAVLSIMAGVPISRMVKELSHDAVVRAMPNMPAQIGQGISVWTATPAVSEQARQSASAVLGALGQQVQVPEERLLDTATALNGSGPAYALLFMEALVDAGVYLGLTRELSRTLAVQTVAGSAAMAIASPLHLAELRDMVTSPGGTTAEALLVLEDSKFRAAVMNAVIAAYKKSRSLGA